MLMRHQGAGGSKSEFPMLCGARATGAFLEGGFPLLYQNFGNWFWYHEDFLRDAIESDPPFTAYDNTPTGSPTVGLVASSTGGQYQMKLTNDNEAQELALTWGGNLPIAGNKPFFFATRVQVVHAMAANQRIVLGLASARTNVLDDITRNAWFRLEADFDLLIETDDGTNDNDDKDTGFDIVEDTWYWYAIERGITGQTYFTIAAGDSSSPRTWTMRDRFNAVEPSFGANNLQPIFVVQKASGTTTPEILIDSYAFGAERA